MKGLGKFFAKCALLTAIVTAALWFLSPVLTPKWVEGHADNGGTYMTTTTQGFLSLKKNSVDLLLVGSSQVLRDVDTVQLTEGTGLSAYSRATTVQPPSVSYYYLEDALKTQKPKLVMADFSCLYEEYDPDEREPYVRYAFDWIPLSSGKLQAVGDVIEGSDQSMLDYILPGLYYHGRWADLTRYDFEYLFEEDRTDPQRGAILLDDPQPQDFTPLDGGSMEPAPFAESSLVWYQKMMDLCKDRNVPFVTLRLPRVGWTEERHAADLKLAEENQVPLLDFNVDGLYRKVGLDARTDFYDTGHLCRSGAEKLTSWLEGWLRENGYC